MRVTTERTVVLVLLCACLMSRTATAGMRGSEASGKPPVTVQEGDREAAWVRLEDTFHAMRKPEKRILAITSLALLGGVPRAEAMVEGALNDSTLEVRLAAVVAAGEMAKTGGPRDGMIGHLRTLLNDPEPAVAFTAANALWKLGDVSGEDILVTVADGERSTTDNLWKSTRHNASRELHSPEALAKIGAIQGISMLVPPIGIGMGAYQYLRGSNDGPNPRVTAVTELGADKSAAVRRVLIDATRDKDAGVRLAAVEALAQYRGPEVQAAVEALLTDSKENVRLMADAALIRVMAAPVASRVPVTSRLPGTSHLPGTSPGTSPGTRHRRR